MKPSSLYFVGQKMAFKALVALNRILHLTNVCLTGADCTSQCVERLFRCKHFHSLSVLSLRVGYRQLTNNQIILQELIDEPKYIIVLCILFLKLIYV